MTHITAADARPVSPPTLPPRLVAGADRGGTVTFVTGAGDGPGYSTEIVEWARLHDDALFNHAIFYKIGARF